MSATATQGTSIAVLAPYLPYGIEMAWVEAPYDMLGKGHCLCSLSSWEGHEVAIGHRAASGMFDWWSYKNVLPVLRSFADLCTPLADGTVPAVQMVAIGSPHLKAITAAIEGEDEIHVKAGGGHCARLFKNDFEAGAMGLNQATYLRSQHFAVGLEPHQYIRKTN